MSGKTSREITADMLIAVYKDHKKSHLVLKETLDKYDGLDKQDRSFITRIFKGTIENTIREDYVIGLYSKTKINKIKPLVLALLRMSIYQILFMNEVPDSAAVNESVKIIKKRGLKGLVPFANGILRTIVREKDNIKYPDKSDYSKYLSVKYSMPLWIVDLIIKEYGFLDDLGGACADKNNQSNGYNIKNVEKCDIDNLDFINANKLEFNSTLKNIFEYFSKPHKLTIRLNISKFIKDKKNTDKLTADDIKRAVDTYTMLLDKKGVQYTVNKYYDYALDIIDVDKVAALPGYKDGYFVVQDPSSMLIGEIARHLDFDNALDMCSAPGGKAMHVADMHPRSEVTANDVSQTKVDLIENNIARTGLFNIIPEVSDGTVNNPNYIDKFDLVIMDVPCSGIGVIGTKSDIKYNISPDSVKSLSVIQEKIVQNGVEYLKKDGYLIYSTCTLNKNENIDKLKVIKDCGFEPVDITGFIPSAVIREWNEIREQYLTHNNENLTEDEKNSFVQIVPGINDMNGFFVTVWKKIV